MDESHLFVAVDLGASNGRVMLAKLARGVLTLREAHRFAHDIVERDGVKRWDWDRLRGETRSGLAKACEMAGAAPVAGVACCGWAQDFGLLDGKGQLFYPPVSYRDTRTAGMPERFAEIIPPRELLLRTGSVIHPMTTLCQLRAMVEREPEALRRARQLLWIADLVHHDLCGAATTDFTLATAAQMRNVETGEWDADLLDRLGIPTGILPPILDGPRPIGRVTPERAPHAKLVGVPVVGGAGHDTAAATTALAPLKRGDLFVSLGTWAMLGCCTDRFGLDGSFEDESLAALGLAFGKWGLFHGGMGLWLLQECRRAWRDRGLATTEAELTAAAETSEIESVIPANDPRFFAPEDMPAEIAAACRESGQRVPEAPGDFARVVFAGLAAAFAESVERLSAASGLTFRRLNVIGGGSRIAPLCRRIAEATGLPVAAGPAEATAAGLALTQALGLGILDEKGVADVAEASFGREG